MPSVMSGGSLMLNHEMICHDCDVEFGSDALKRTYSKGMRVLVMKCPYCKSENVEFVSMMRSSMLRFLVIQRFKIHFLVRTVWIG